MSAALTNDTVDVIDQPTRPVPEWMQELLPVVAALIADPVEDATWHPAAACRGVDDPDWWFPKRGVSVAPIRQVCGTCPVRLRCLAEAARTGEMFGVWGGASPRELVSLRAVLGLSTERNLGTDEHCSQGHPWTEDTLAYTPTGKPWCRACNRIAKRDERRRARGSAVGSADGRHRTRGTT